ncbi:Hypothetical_protein [Hexamita inflata]|uniref:Hypothetical_protein n=1 Tax=Hexamita inflata TaxID=28002 RepID=A0AA86Q6H5_9EUKA|nr:Hypothetical protein HINF_LOCUS34555 [Hexamita inflata]
MSYYQRITPQQSPINSYKIDTHIEDTYTKEIINQKRIIDLLQDEFLINYKVIEASQQLVQQLSSRIKENNYFDVLLICVFTLQSMTTDFSPDLEKFLQMSGSNTKLDQFKWLQLRLAEMINFQFYVELKRE